MGCAAAHITKMPSHPIQKRAPGLSGSFAPHSPYACRRATYVYRHPNTGKIFHDKFRKATTTVQLLSHKCNEPSTCLRESAKRGAKKHYSPPIYLMSVHHDCLHAPTLTTAQI
uniref:Uncharacterized protein n=1 Tax=Trypanosoma congolense (strain IL3000) TaxID=1068625 RepID=F9W367_TRYCI|nr:hypothetical protein, unlikely [Trypanosoma congolense IL3000]